MKLTTILRSGVGPPAIGRFVIAVVVDAVKARAFRAWTHVAKERLEAVDPFRANRDTASAPTFKADGVGIQTATLHRSPRSIFTTPHLTAVCRTAGMAVSEMWRSIAPQSRNPFMAQASATLGNTRNDQRRANDFRRAAIAMTDPSMVWRDGCHDESMEPISERDRERWTHSEIISRGFVHQTD